MFPMHSPIYYVLDARTSLTQLNVLSIVFIRGNEFQRLRKFPEVTGHISMANHDTAVAGGLEGILHHP